MFSSASLGFQHFPGTLSSKEAAIPQQLLFNTEERVCEDVFCFLGESLMEA